jgi:glycine betaine/proline transport system ATP-binding protein
MKKESEFAIEVSKVWKLFGKNHKAAFKAVLEQGISKKQVLEQYDCVVGVADVSFTVKPGQIYCIMGLSGSGKSTLVRHINRLLEPTYGEVLINGVDIMSFEDKELQRFRNNHIAMVFQHFGLMPHRSVLDNISLSLEIRGVNKNKCLEIAERNLHLVNLDGWGNKFANELSGGMQQRVGLARALAADPDILLMDEPFSALDPLIRNQLQKQLIWS